MVCFACEGLGGMPDITGTYTQWPIDSNLPPPFTHTLTVVHYATTLNPIMWFFLDYYLFRGKWKYRIQLWLHTMCYCLIVLCRIWRRLHILKWLCDGHVGYLLKCTYLNLLAITTSWSTLYLICPSPWDFLNNVLLIL